MSASLVRAANIVLDADNSKISFVKFKLGVKASDGQEEEVYALNATTLTRLRSRLFALNNTLIDKVSMLNKMFYSLPCHVSCRKRGHCVGPLLQHCCKEDELVNKEDGKCTTPTPGTILKHD